MPKMAGFVPGDPAVEEAATQLVDAGYEVGPVEAMKLCEATSFIGLPSVAVPTGLRDGLPTAVQVIFRMYREDLALDAALEVPLSPAVSAG